ncbi:MAG: prolyl-tRNA synthetase [Candidatus Desulfovibrio kirbyi]|jgi:prolyl-tRNA synthetase|uniref:Proline--tRNA ligase n=1 Tax=Candidatus Desulfovibrio kirbyi TaxID=2696086 RepID=A0A6L2R592_9BACT|nr:proline--tRNA ligase [Desulfovibrio sp.]GFH62685.1 MAG: prolyl-tRNA synthetase [Candidatus Desulfovibrio kirbyi]
MRFTSSYIPTLRESPADAEVVSHKLLLRAGMVRQLTSGLYCYLPLGLKVINKIADIVRSEMDNAGFQELLLPMVQPADLWKETGRWEHYGKELLRFQDRNARDYCLGPTHEEVITSLVRGEVRSYRHLPVRLYQIQTKFRDETRPRFGLMRGREFIMKDAYSFDADVAGAEKSYAIMKDAYMKIFSRIGLKFRAVEADNGSIGGKFSHEFMVLADTGEDSIVVCPQCDYAANVEVAQNAADVCPCCRARLTRTKGIEVGHVFMLDKKYSEPMRAVFLDEAGSKQVMAMGCYGIGVSRIAAAALEQNHDENGCLFPPPIAPFECVLLNLDCRNMRVNEKIEELYAYLLKAGIDALLDDRDERPGAKFKDADLLGAPMQLTLGGKSLERGVVECKNRRTGEKSEIDLSAFGAAFPAWAAGVRENWGV